MSGVDPELARVVAILETNPERAKVIRGYPYRVATIRSSGPGYSVDITKLLGLWEHLSHTAGWKRRNNHSVFVFDLDGHRHAVLFTDSIARFGQEEDVCDRPSP